MEQEWPHQERAAERNQAIAWHALAAHGFNLGIREPACEVGARNHADRTVGWRRNRRDGAAL